MTRTLLGTYLAFGAICMLSGCGKSASDAPRETRRETTPKYFVVLDRVPPTTVRVRLDEKEVGRAVFTREIVGSPTEIPVTEPLNSYWTVEALTPDGWAPFVAESGPPARKKSAPDNLYYEVKVRRVKFCTIWVDNRDGSDVTLTCGEVEREVPANFAGQLLFLTPHQDFSRAPLMMGSQFMKSLATENDKKCYVLDVSGKRAYTVQTTYYGGGDTQRLVNEGALELDTAPTILEGAHLYELRKLDIFLGHAPESVHGSQSQFDLQSRTALTDYDPDRDPK
ncbi:MAG: hypothetical protein KDB01_22520 [Planctomycetaceae bacterium]|nr:hypothetical protein [Planctomycetaceae bacterium]